MNEKERTQHNAPKRRFGYKPRTIKTAHLAGYNLQIDHRGRVYVSWKGSLRRCDMLPTKAGYALAGPDDRQFRIFGRDGNWILRDVKTKTDFPL